MKTVTSRMRAIVALALVTVLSLMTVNLHVISASQVFLDVSPTQDAWCYTQVMKAYNIGLINGYGNGYFGKNDPITRGQIVQILYNHYGTDVGTNSGFSDVPSSMWCSKAVTWAVKNKIVSGYSNGTFCPNNRLTREQMVSILYNLAGKPAVDSAGALSQFTDRDKVASYAVNGFAWAVSNGIVSGTSTTTLSPQGTATRAQVAVIMIRYIEKFEGSVPEYVPDPEPTYEAKNSDGTTNADYVNSINDHKKSNDYPTYGSASTVNDNGYFTKADVDIDGAVLQYDALQFLNAFLAENGKEPARWVSIDEAEEYALTRAKEAYVNFDHVRPANAAGKTGIMTGENLYQGYGSASSVIKAWDASSGHHRTMLACSGREVCIARYGTTWVLVGFSDNGLKSAVNQAAQNYYN